MTGVRVVLQMAADEKLPVVLALDGENARLVRDSQQLQLGDLQDILLPVFRIPGVGRVKHIIKAPKEGGASPEGLVGEYAEELFRQTVFGDAVMIVQACLRTPADMQGGMYVGLGPLHDLAQLVQ